MAVAAMADPHPYEAHAPVAVVRSDVDEDRIGSIVDVKTVITPLKTCVIRGRDGDLAVRGLREKMALSIGMWGVL